MPTSEETRIALERADKLVALAPERGLRTYVNKAVVTGGTLCSVEEKGFTLLADAGRGMGGGNENPTPSTYLRAGLSSCIAIGIKLWAARRNVPIDRVEVTIETDTDARGILGMRDDVRPGFTGLRAVIEVSSQAPAESIEEIVATSIKYSPLVDALASTNSLETQTRILEPVAMGGRNGR